MLHVDDIKFLTNVKTIEITLTGIITPKNINAIRVRMTFMIVLDKTSLEYGVVETYIKTAVAILMHYRKKRISYIFEITVS